jgi:hypothetical protein
MHRGDPRVAVLRFAVYGDLADLARRPAKALPTRQKKAGIARTRLKKGLLEANPWEEQPGRKDGRRYLSDVRLPSIYEFAAPGPLLKEHGCPAAAA